MRNTSSFFQIIICMSSIISSLSYKFMTSKYSQNLDTETNETLTENDSQNIVLKTNLTLPENDSIDKSSTFVDVKDYFAVKISPVVVEFYTNLNSESSSDNYKLKEIIQDFLSFQYDEEFDNFNNVEVEILGESRRKLFKDYNSTSTTSIFRLFSGTAFFTTNNVPSTKELDEFTKISFSEDNFINFYNTSAKKFMEPLEETSNLNHIEDVTIYDFSPDTTETLLTPFQVSHEKKSSVSILGFVSTLFVACSVLSIFIFIVMKRRMSYMMEEIPNRNKLSKTHHDVSDKTLREIIDETTSLDGLKVIDNLSQCSELYTPSLTFSQSFVE